MNSKNDPAAEPNPETEGINGIYLIPEAPLKLGEAAYHGFVGEFIRAVSPYTEATDAALLGHLLPAVGSIIGPGPYVWGGDEQPARVNTVLPGPTSTGRKGTAKAINKKLLRAVDAKFCDEQCVGGMSSGEGVIQKVSDRHSKDKDGNEQIEMVEKRLLVVEPEFSRVLLQSQRLGNILSQVLRESYDSGNLNVLTRNPLSAINAHICIVGHITVEELRKRLTETEMANGFANRFLWLYTESEKELPDAKPLPILLISRFAQRLSKIIIFSQKQLRIEKDEQATELFNSVYGHLRSAKPGLQGSMLARGESIVLRVALIYALLDESKIIRREHIEAALAVWEYNVQTVKLIFGDSEVGDSLQEHLYKLLAAGPLTATEFHSHTNKSATEIKAALTYLESIGRVQQVKVSHKGAGRPAVQWQRVATDSRPNN